MRRKAKEKHFFRCLPANCSRSAARGRYIRKTGILAFVTILVLSLASCSGQRADTEKGGQPTMDNRTETDEMEGHRGRNMAYLLRCQEAARAAGVAMPEREEPFFTNFIR